MYKITSERKESLMSLRTLLKKPEFTIPRILACLMALVIEETLERTTCEGEFFWLGASAHLQSSDNIMNYSLQQVRDS